MVIEGAPIEIDAVVVWRIVGGQIAEAWDIPAVNTARAQTRTEPGAERPEDGG